MFLKLIAAIFLILIGTCSVPFVPIVKAQGFSAVLEDLPMMYGLVEDKDNSLMFDKPSGRFVEVLAQSDILSSADIISFYEQTLPSLGWTKISPKNYVRQGEELKINIEQSDSKSFVVFTLMPVEKF